MEKLEETRPTLIDLHVDDWGDRKRVRVFIEFDQVITPPNLELNIFTDEGRLSATTNIIETIAPKVVITQHLQVHSTTDEYRLEAILSLPGQPPYDTQTINFKLHG